MGSKSAWRSFPADLLWCAVGCFIYAAAVTVFTSANELSPGGITGIATILQYLFSVPGGLTVLLLNLPILLIGFRRFGGLFLLKTALATLLLSAALTLTDALLPAVRTDRILAALFGGILMGFGTGLVMVRGATTGGVDIIAKLIQRRFRFLTVGRLILMLDAAVITLAALAYRNMESALYSAVSLFVSSQVIDLVLYGFDRGKLLYVISRSPEEISREIGRTLQRGVTLIPARGGYTGESRTLLLCTVRRHEVAGIYRIVAGTDPDAFVIVSDAAEIFGLGFKRFES